MSCDVMLIIHVWAGQSQQSSPRASRYGVPSVAAESGAILRSFTTDCFSSCLTSLCVLVAASEYSSQRGKWGGEYLSHDQAECQ